METTSLELSKRLHELGFKGESEYVWAYNYGGGFVVDRREAVEPDFYDTCLGVCCQQC